LSHELLDSWRKQWDLLVEALTPSVKVASVIVSLSSGKINPHSYKSHLELSVILIFFIDFDDCGFDPFACVVLGID
jgi:hypothetical protein